MDDAQVTDATVPGRTVPTLPTVAAVTHVVATARAPLHLRVGHVDDDDLGAPSTDHESGLVLPGLSVNPLSAPPWWTDRPLEWWVARQICTYAHLLDADPSRSCTVVTGTEVGRGPDNEPLLTEVRLLAVLHPAAVEEARRLHSAWARSPRPEDSPDERGTAPWQS